MLDRAATRGLFRLARGNLRCRFPHLIFRVFYGLVVCFAVPFVNLARAQSADTLVLALGAEPKSFNEIIAQETTTTEVTGLMFEGLTRFNPLTGAVEPRLAESWEVSPDGLEWIFHLRQDVQWFDGYPFTAKDVVFTFRSLIFNPSVIAPARDIFTLGGKPVQVEAVDALTVRFRLPVPFAPFLLALNQSIFPEHALKSAVAGGNFQSAWGADSPSDAIIGTGPFKLKRYVPGERVELVRNEKYWKKDESGKALPYIGRIIGLIVPSADGRLLKFLEGQTDIYILSGADYPLLKPKQQRGRFNLVDAGASAGSYFLAFNQNTPNLVHREWFQSRVFRQASAHALDRQSMIDIIFNRNGVPQCSPLSPSWPYFYNAKVSCYEFNPEKARQMLKAGGFSDRDGDGFLEDKKGNAVQFTLLTNAENPERLQMAGMAREDMSSIGLKVNLLAVEFNTLVTKLSATHDWDAVLLGLTGETDPHFGANVWRTDGSLHFWNAGKGAVKAAGEDEIDAIFRQAASLMKMEDRKKLYDEWQAIAARELPMIYTVLPRTVYAIRNRLQNVKPSAIAGPLYNIEELRIKE